MIKAIIGSVTFLSGVLACFLYAVPDLKPLGYVIVYALGAICLLGVLALKAMGCLE